ncbi:hypothetical protein, partial [Enterococcus faecium]|uniref:hypothetical protein n=1 Tax=Enterococcus faecium TaxID=1352 RepID=UPI003907FC72
FTLDDGYRDNFDHAYPVFRAADAPFTIFVPSGWPSGQGRLWWQTLEDSVRVLPKIEINCRGSRMVFPSATVAEKRRAFVAIRNHLHELD